MRNVATIALNTFREAVRDRIMLVAMIMCVIFALSTILILEFTVTQWMKMVTDFGLNVLRIGGVAMVFLMGAGVVGKELSRRTVYVVFAKPVKKWEFVLGKFFGIMLLLAINTLILLILVYGAVYYVNYRIKEPIPPLYIAYLEVLCEVSILSSFVIWLSTVFSKQTASLGLLIFFAGVHQIQYLKSWLEGFAGNLFTYILAPLPDFSMFYTSQQVVEYIDRIGVPKIPIPWEHIAFYTVLSLVYTALFLYAASHFLKKRELGE